RSSATARSRSQLEPGKTRTPARIRGTPPGNPRSRCWRGASRTCVRVPPLPCCGPASRARARSPCRRVRPRPRRSRDCRAHGESPRPGGRAHPPSASPRPVPSSAHPSVDELRAGNDPSVRARQHAKAPRDLRIGVGETAEILAEHVLVELAPGLDVPETTGIRADLDRKSTRLNSSHVKSSYAVFCLKKKTKPY